MYRVYPRSRSVQGPDDVAFPKLVLGAAMELDQVEPVGFQPLKAALDAPNQRFGPPIFRLGTLGVSALGEQVERCDAPTACPINSSLWR